jgi:hypothetical protein
LKWFAENQTGTLEIRMPDGPARDSTDSLRINIEMENRDPTVLKVIADNLSAQVRCSQGKKRFNFFLMLQCLNQANINFLHRPPASRRQAAFTGRATFRPPNTETGRASYCPDPEDLQNELLMVHFDCSVSSLKNFDALVSCLSSGKYKHFSRPCHDICGPLLYHDREMWVPARLEFPVCPGIIFSLMFSKRQNSSAKCAIQTCSLTGDIAIR